MRIGIFVYTGVCINANNTKKYGVHVQGNRNGKAAGFMGEK